MVSYGIARSLKSAASGAVSMNGSVVVGKELHVDTGRPALHDPNLTASELLSGRSNQ